MKFLLSTVIVSAIFVFAQRCGKDDGTDAERSGIPECIQAKITEISQEGVWNPPAKVYGYRFKGKKVYFIPQRCCDFPSQLFDDTCQLICAPDGGYTGAGNSACPDFFADRTNETLLWEDKR